VSNVVVGLLGERFGVQQIFMADNS